MKMSLFRKLLVLWMVCWLPASGALAAMMPISSLSAAAGSAIAADLPMPCHQAMAKAGQAEKVNMAHGGGCTHCVLCHLAGALMLPALPIVEGMAPSHHFAAVAAAPLVSFFPEPLSPPPRSIAA